MKPMIETTVFNTKEDGRGQVVADLMAYQKMMAPWAGSDAAAICNIALALEDYEEDNSPIHHEIKIFSGDIDQVKEINAPYTEYYWGDFIVIKTTAIP